MKTVGNKNCVGFLTVMARVSALGVMLSAAAFGQGQSTSGSEEQKSAEGLHAFQKGFFEAQSW
jgi:hypothetical protein